MATTMVPPSTSPSPSSAPKPGNRGELRFVAIRANLLPAEIISDRQTVVVRKQVLLGLLIVVALLIGWFGLSWWQTSSSRSDLSDAQRQSLSLQNQQKAFGPLVRAQAESQTIQSQLQKLMVGDLSWNTMLTTLRSKAPAGVSLTTITGNITAATPGAAAAATVPLNQTGKPSIGTLVVTGTAPDKKTVAAYADRLATIKGLTAPLVSSVSADKNTLTFTVNLVVTTDALGGRYASTRTTSVSGGH